MGIRGLFTYVKNQELLQNYHLHDTALVIDGHNLVNSLYNLFQNRRNDHMFGGDYTLWSNYIKKFFNALNACHVVPIVIFDGSFDPSLKKFNTKLKRFKMNLSTAYKLYAHNIIDQKILPLLCIKVFQLVLDMLNINNYQSIYEADDIIPQIAGDLNCPVLSNDSDFMISNLITGGVIITDFLLSNKFKVYTHENKKTHTSYNYMICSIFKLKNIKQKFSNINLDLIQLCSPILGNDYIDSSEARCIMNHIPKFACVGSDREKQINSLLQWISKYNSYEDIFRNLAKFFPNPNHTFLRYIETHFVANHSITSDNKKISQVESIVKYFEENLEKLFFFKKINLSLWMHQRFIKNVVSSRLLCIYETHIEWFTPLVEDFSFSESSYECIYDLCQYIYGILRSTNENIAEIKRYSRRDTNLVVDNVPPRLYINDQLLPMVNEIEFLSIQERIVIFYQILEIDPSLIEHLKTLISVSESKQFTIDPKLSNQLVMMIIIMIYFSRHFLYDLWIEFVYALFFNIFLIGNFCDENMPLLLKIDSTQHKLLKKNLHSFNRVPSFTKVKVFMPRVVHFYNAFQNCFINIAFLVQILDLYPVFDTDQYMLTLKGTFLYNLTCDLCSRPKPLLHLEELLGRKKFMPLSLFHNLLDFVFQHADRKILINGQYDRDVVPCSMLLAHHKVRSNDRCSKERFFVRAFEATNRKTHIKSQNLKLRKKRSRKPK